MGDERKLRQVTAIIFDLDNTLIDTKGVDWQACEEVYEYLLDQGVKKAASRESIQRFYELVRARGEDPGYSVDSWRRLLWAQALGTKHARHADGAYNVWKTYRDDHLVLRPAVIRLLESLRATGFRLAVLTNGPSDAQWAKLDRIDARSLFDAIVVGGDFAEQKPHSSIFEEVFQRLDVSPQECLMVGDKMETDILGGQNAGVAATVLVSRGRREDTSIFSPPDFVIQDVCELSSLLPESPSPLSYRPISTLFSKDLFRSPKAFQKFIY